MTLLWTEHARQRWAERLSQFDPVDEYSRTRLVSRGLKRHIRELCPQYSELMQGFHGFYYLKSPHAVWVMAAPETVVTVWPLPKNFKRTLSKRQEKRLKRLLEQTSVDPGAPA